ncbi:MAG: DNA translocase FtsK 4TM domain-containing protein, partial [Acidimicrobiia bacterium]
MATPRKRSSAKPSPSASSGKGRAATKKRVPAKRRVKRSRRRPTTRRPPARPSAASRARDAIGRQLGSHTADMVGIVLMAIGALTALALATNLVGPIGRALASGITFFLGGGAFLVPLGCFGAAILVLAPRPTDDGETPPPAPLRIGLGIGLLVIGITGLLHLAGDSPSLDAPSDALRRAGGLLGAAVGGPVRSGLGDVGAGVVFLCVAVLGALLAPGIPLRQVLGAIAKASRTVASALRAWLEPTITAEIVDDGDEATALEPEPTALPARRVTAAQLYDQFAEGEPEPEPEEEPEPIVDLADDVPERSGADLAAEDLPAVPVPVLDPAVDDDTSQLAIDLGPRHRPPVWKLPPKTILARGTGGKVDQRVVQAGGQVLEATLREFGVEASLIGMTVGPTVTRYELELAAGVKVSRVTSLNKEIAYSMASHDVRILAPIPGRSAIGVEVPNKQRPLVTLGDVLASDEARKAVNPLEVGLGRDIAGRDVMLELAKMPHLLIAGTTGAGKSSCINSIVTSILMRATPEQVRLILVDPKRVELGRYDGLPHLLTSVVTNPKKAANALDWAVREMEMRYEMLAEVGTRDIDGYNAMYDRGDLPTEDDPDPHGGKDYERLPYILVVVDELSDLMMVAARDVETAVCRLAQMARAVG